MIPADAGSSCGCGGCTYSQRELLRPGILHLQRDSIRQELLIPLRIQHWRRFRALQSGQLVALRNAQVQLQSFDFIEKRPTFSSGCTNKKPEHDDRYDHRGDGEGDYQNAESARKDQRQRSRDEHDEYRHYQAACIALEVVRVEVVVQRRAVSVPGSLYRTCIGVFQNQAGTACKEAREESLLHGKRRTFCLLRTLVQPPFVLQETLVPVDLQMPTNSQGEHVAREAAHVVTTALHVAQSAWRHSLTRRVARNDYALARVPAHSPPLQEAVQHYSNQSGQGNEHSAIVTEKPAQSLCGGRCLYHALGKGENYRHSLARCEWLCKLVHGSSGRGKRRSVVGSLLSLGASVGLGSHLSHRHWFRQPNLNGARVDGECPAGAYRVPVQLVVIVEESELP